jgi:hypothetical protein
MTGHHRRDALNCGPSVNGRAAVGPFSIPERANAIPRDRISAPRFNETFGCKNVDHRVTYRGVNFCIDPPQADLLGMRDNPGRHDRAFVRKQSEPVPVS